MSHQNLASTLNELQRRLTALQSKLNEAPEAQNGMEMLLEGVKELLGTIALLESQDDNEQARLDVLIQGVHGVLDYFEPEQPMPDGDVLDDTTPAVPQGLEQFIDGFRREGQKRLTGLSISMMGLFNAQADSRAIDTSAQHLHAIRGGAAMLNLTSVAQISGLMEQLLLSMKRVPSEARTWPTQSLMRGYQMLERALANPQVKLSQADTESTIESLRQCFDGLDDVSHVLDEANDEPELVYMEHKKHVITSTETKPTSPNTPMEQRLLIVDDVETVAASVGFVLSEIDVPLDIATNGAEALRMLKMRPYSLVISDIAMPRMDGIALTSMIRRDAQLSDIPVILLTSLDHPNERDAGIGAGANDYIIKGSIGGGELVARVQELLKIAPFVPIEPPKALQTKKRVLIAEDAETVAASIAFVLSEGNLDIAIASDGMEALGRLEREHFDILISDWQMPTMSGIELVKAVRASTIIEQLPIILLTSLSSEAYRQEAHKAGANAYLVKGNVAGGMLINVANRLLEQFQP